MAKSSWASWALGGLVPGLLGGFFLGVADPFPSSAPSSVFGGSSSVRRWRRHELWTQLSRWQRLGTPQLAFWLGPLWVARHGGGPSLCRHLGWLGSKGRLPPPCWGLSTFGGGSGRRGAPLECLGLSGCWVLASCVRVCLPAVRLRTPCHCVHRLVLTLSQVFGGLGEGFLGHGDGFPRVVNPSLRRGRLYHLAVMCKV